MPHFLCIYRAFLFGNARAFGTAERKFRPDQVTRIPRVPAKPDVRAEA